MSSRNGNQELHGDGDAQRHGDVKRTGDAEKIDRYAVVIMLRERIRTLLH